MISKVEIVDIDSIHIDKENPRSRDPLRFELVKQSIRVFGHILPTYVDPEGNIIISGSQRTAAGRELGFPNTAVTFLPVQKDTASTPALTRLGMNILANTITNDTTHIGATIIDHLEAAEAERLVGLLADMPTCPEEDWPVLSVVSESVAELLEANPEIDYLVTPGVRAASTSERSYKWTIPIVVTDGLKLVNGASRLAAAQLKHRETIECVHIKAGHAELAGKVMNKISMDHDLTAAAETFRSGPWLNHFRARTSLGKTWNGWSHPSLTANAFSLGYEPHRKKWIEEHGTYIADLGAGHIAQSGTLNVNGIKAVPFEPFVVPLGGQIPCIETTRKVCGKFLEEIARGRKFDSVFIADVLNQVPYRKDRFMLCTLGHALCSRSTNFYTKTMSEAHYKVHATTDRSTSTGTDPVLGPEERTLIFGISSGRPIIQKYHTKADLENILSPLWRTCTYRHADRSWYVKCQSPKRVNPSLLRSALEFEFNLPFHNGERLGLHEVACEAFSERLGMDI